MKSVFKKIGDFFENIWYHYKWLILIILVLGTLIIVSVSQIIEKGEPDVHIMFIGQNYITAEGRDQMENNLKKIIDDYNGDGRITMDLVELTVTTVPGERYDYEYQQDAITRFDMEIRSGESTVFIVEDSFYAKIRELGVAAPLEDVFGEGNVPSYANDEYSFRLRDLDIAEEEGFDRFPRESIVCIRYSPDHDDINYARTIEAYENDLKFFKNMTTYKSSFVLERPTVGILHVNESYLTPLSVHKLDTGVYLTYKDFEESSVAGVNYKSVVKEKNKTTEQYISEVEKEIKSGAYGVVFIDSSYVNILSEKGLLTPMSELFPDYLSKKGATTYGMYYDFLKIKNVSGFCYMNGSETTEKTMVVALVAPDAFSSKDVYEKYKAYYKHLVEFTPPEVNVE